MINFNWSNSDKIFNFVREVLGQVLVVPAVIQVNVGKFEIHTVRLKRKYLINPMQETFTFFLFLSLFHPTSIQVPLQRKTELQRETIELFTCLLFRFRTNLNRNKLGQTSNTHC